MHLPIDYNNSHWSVRKQAREQYVKKQDGKCCYCKKNIFGKPSKEVMSKPINKKLFPHSMFLHPIHLHHDRTTGKSIGAAHARCNAYMWQYLGQ